MRTSCLLLTSAPRDPGQGLLHFPLLLGCRSQHPPTPHPPALPSRRRKWLGGRESDREREKEGPPSPASSGASRPGQGRRWHWTPFAPGCVGLWPLVMGKAGVSLSPRRSLCLSLWPAGMGLCFCVCPPEGRGQAILPARSVPLFLWEVCA